MSFFIRKKKANINPLDPFQNPLHPFHRIIQLLKAIRCPDEDKCLLSLYVPPEYDISNLIQELADYAEPLSSGNSRVIETLNHALNFLTNRMNNSVRMNTIRPDGFVLFVGPEGFRLIVEHPLLFPHFDAYRKSQTTHKHLCIDSVFRIEFIEGFPYGLLVLNASNATIAVFKAGKPELVKITSRTHNDQTSGQKRGSSQQLNENEDQFLRQIAQDVKKAFTIHCTSEAIIGVEGILIGGLGSTKMKFIENNYLDARLKEKLLKIVNTSYLDSKLGLEELIDLSQDVLTTKSEEKAL
ncbi:MAG: hypothetical protein ACFFC7_26470 [Candidatus Hermodarchaeota archaeon]